MNKRRYKRLDIFVRMSYDIGVGSGVGRKGVVRVRFSKEVFRNLAMITQLGIQMLAPIVLCVFVGDQLDTRFGWHTTVWLLILGILAGCRNCWMFVKRLALSEQGKDAKAQGKEMQAQGKDAKAQGKEMQAQGEDTEARGEEIQTSGKEGEDGSGERT